MYKFISMAKTRALPAVIAAVFVAGTAFLSSAAAQKMIRVAVSPQSQKSEKKNSLKVAQAAVAGARVDSSAGAEGGSGHILRTASSGTALVALTASASQGDLPTSNSTVASTTAQTANLDDTQNNQSSTTVGIRTNIATTPANNTTIQNNTASAASSGNVFTLQTLAQHNKAGDCYIAYKGTVYDLSNVASWANCQHHGATGGIDVTAMFPHPVSYFNSVPVIGTLGTAVATTGQTAGSGTSQSSQSTAANATGSITTSTTTGSQASGTSGVSAGSGNTGSSGASRSGWTDDDGFKSQTSDSSSSRFEDDDETGE